MTITDTNTITDFPPPPPGPPPLLSEPQILTLAHHGHVPISIPPALSAQYAALSAAASSFFDQPQSTKQSTYPPSEGTELGYINVPGEKEYISLRCLTHPDTPLEKLASSVWRDTTALLHRVLGDLSWAMDCPLEAFDPVLDGVSPIPEDLASSTPTLLRMFRYCPDSGIAEPHTDLGLLTLCVGDGQGLQVLVRDEEGGLEGARWFDVEGPTLLVGNILRILSGDRVRGGLHRVVGNPDGRSSIVFALRPSLKHEIDMGGFPGGEGTVHMRDMWEKIRKGAYNINAQKEVRERQRERLRDKGKGKMAVLPDTTTTEAEYSG
jgi:isopenicillin N synthase-like dioxygenase